MSFLKSWLSPDALALIFLATWRLVLYLPVTLGQRVFSEGDITWLFLPIRTELARAIGEGRLPLWTPALQAGFPLFAEGEMGALYPINLLLHRFFSPPVGLSYSILFNLSWATIGMYLLCRTFALRPASAWLGAFVFGAGGYFTAQLPHAPHVTVAAWLPWLLFFQQKSFQARRQHQRSILWFLAMSMAVALQLLGGFPQFAVFNIVTLNLFALAINFFQLPSSISPKLFLRSVSETVFISASATLLGTGLAAIQLLPTIELIGLSIRGQEMSQAFFTSYSLALTALTQFVAPFASLGVPQAANTEYWAYLGVLPFLLMLLAPVLRRDRRTLFVAAFGVICLLFALGGNTPLYDWLYQIPVFNRFRVPARFLMLFTFAAAFLAASSFQELQNRLRETRSNKIIFAIALPCAAISGYMIYLAYNTPFEFWLEIWQWLAPLVVGLSILILALSQWRGMPRGVWITLVISLTVIDLAAFSAIFNSTLNRSVIPADMFPIPRTIQAMDDRQPLYRVHETKVPMTDAAIRAVLFTNLPIIYGKQSISGYLPSLGLQRNQKYMDEMSLGMRNLIGMRYYLLPLEMPSFGDPLPPWWDEIEPDGGLTPEVLSAQHPIPPTRVSRILVTSYTDETSQLTDGHLVGELQLKLEKGESVKLPIRLGIESADWAHDVLPAVKHSKPGLQETFPAYLKSIGRAFEGRKYVATYELARASAPLIVTSVSARSFLPVGGLNLERVLLIDEVGQSRSLAALWYRNDLALAFRSHAAAMWENRDVLPRAFVVPRAAIVDGDEALARLKEPGFPYRQLVLLSDAPASAIVEGSTSAETSNVTITEYKPERVAASVQMNAPGYLVLTDSWYPGWGVWVDGIETPLYRANYIFRAVPLGAGRHSVVFEYRPASLMWGTAISGLCVLGCIALAIWKLKRRTNRNDSG